MTIKLLADGKEKGSCVLNEGNGWTHTFKDLPKYYKGVLIVYTVEEEPLAGYDTRISGSAGRGFIVTNIQRDIPDPPVPSEPPVPSDPPDVPDPPVPPVPSEPPVPSDPPDVSDPPAGPGGGDPPTGPNSAGPPPTPGRTDPGVPDTGDNTNTAALALIMLLSGSAIVFLTLRIRKELHSER